MIPECLKSSAPSLSLVYKLLTKRLLQRTSHSNFPGRGQLPETTSVPAMWIQPVIQKLQSFETVIYLTR